jgi:hypothetical protein
MRKNINWVSFILIINLLTNGLLGSDTLIKDELLHNTFEKMYQTIMKNKVIMTETNRFTGPVFINTSSSAPNNGFIINTEISDSLLLGSPSLVTKWSFDNQLSWESDDAYLRVDEGFETVWETLSDDIGNSMYWFMSGEFYVEVDENLESAIFTQSPKNIENIFPAPINLLQDMSYPETGNVDENQDITALKGTYSDENLYFKLSIAGECCVEGEGLFGPWYLYGIGIVNPDSESAVGYAVGYAVGGFGSLMPGLIKMTGDLETGELESFEYIDADFEYQINGSNLDVYLSIESLTNDSDFGPWPNSSNSMIISAMTLSASMDNDINIIDTALPGIGVWETQFQNANSLPNLSNESIDIESNTISITYQDDDGNLPTARNGYLVYEGSIIESFELIPHSHDYLNGVIFSYEFSSLQAGEYFVEFIFSDNYDENYINIILDFAISESSIDEDIVKSFNLLSAYPNPFNPITVVSYQLVENGEINIDIYDINGHLIESLYDGYQNKGKYEIVWDAQSYSTGVYFVKYKTNSQSVVHKLLLIK